MSKSNSELMDQSEKLYDQYGKPLEQDHWGEYVAIFPDGRTLVGTDLTDVSDQALAQFGKGSFVYSSDAAKAWMGNTKNWLRA